MTESTTTLPPNTLQLYDNTIPGLDSGTYTITTEHTLDVDGATIPPASQPFTVQGPRFTLQLFVASTRFSYEVVPLFWRPLQCCVQ